MKRTVNGSITDRRYSIAAAVAAAATVAVAVWTSLLVTGWKGF